MRDQEQHYLKVQKLIFAKAHSFARTTGYDAEELIAQGNLIYCQALLRYDPKRAKFISLLYLSLDQGLIEYTSRLSKQLPKYEEIEETKINSFPAFQERSCIVNNNINKLSNETKKIVYLILNKPSKIFGDRALKPRQMYGAIRWHLRSVIGCSWGKTKKTLNELKDFAYNN